MSTPDGLMESLPALLLWFWPLLLAAGALAWRAVAAVRLPARRPKLAVVRPIALAGARR